MSDIVYNKMKANEYKHSFESYEDKETPIDFPKMCVLSFVYVCNAKCPGCPYVLSDIRNKYKSSQYMSKEIFRKIADECGRERAYLRLSGGGEPMIHPKAVELIEYAKNVGAKVGLITNGSLFNEENSTRLLNAQVDMIEFSVDACDAETYKKVRGGLDFENLLTNVDRMMTLRNKLNSSTRIIASAINQKNVNLDNVEEFWKPRVDHVQLRKFLTWGIGDTSNSGDVIPYLPKEEKHPCPWLFERINIDSIGQVTLCGYDIAFNYVLGNINNSSIKEIWLGDNFNNLRKLHLNGERDKIDICRTCTDGQYRTWTYNYWELLKKAEENRKNKI